MNKKACAAADAAEYSRRLSLFQSKGHTQVPPGNRADWEHVDYANTVGFVLFRHKETGEECACPNIWYNQPVEARIEAMDYYIKESHLRLTYWRSVEGKDRDAKHHITDLLNSIARLEKLRDDMKETGKVLG